MTRRINVKTLFKAALCVVLALSLSGLIEFAATVRADSSPRYLCDIKLFYVDHKADSDEAPIIAKAKCEALGYTLLNADLNSGTGKDWVYIGYKTTTNPDLAITDIRLLGMDRDYYLFNYSEITQYIKDSNMGTAYTMYNAANDFIAKYNAGSPKAADALKGLNLFCVKDKNTKFGDYVLAGKATVDFFVEMIIKASSGTVNAVLGFLNMGIAPYELSATDELPDIVDYSEEEVITPTEVDLDVEDDTETDAGDEDDEPEKTVIATTETYRDKGQTGYTGVNWAEAISHADRLETMKEGLTSAEKSELHKKYNDDARDVFKQLQTFATMYENAAARNAGGSEEALQSLADEVKKDQIKTNGDAVENMENLEEEDADAIFLSAYETLNRYKTADGMKLGEWIVSIGLLTSDEVDITEVYPLVEAMGKAQTGIVRTVGLVSAVSNLNENEASKKLANLIPEVQAVIKDYNKTDCVSIWDTADDDIENSYIAYTSDAVRVANANNFIGRRDKFDIVDEKLQNVLKWVNMATSIAFAAVLTIQTVFQVVTATCASAAAAVAAGGFLAGMGAFIAVASTALMWGSIFVLAFTIGWAIGKWIASKIKKANPTLKHSKFPEYVFDLADSSTGKITIKYKCVKDENNQVGDVNARQQESWAALCYTTDTSTGSPIRADDGGTIFRVFYGDGNVHNGYDCVNFFGERSPANLNYLTTKDKPEGVFLSYRTERSLLQAAPESTVENDVTKVGATEYIADIVVSVGGTANEAKAKIIKKSGSYYILDQNLSPDTNNYTYLAYSLTADPDEAITDIRVAPNQGNGNITYGDIQYTFIGHVGINPGTESGQTSGDAILKTKDPRAGSPIIADGLHVVYSHSQAEAGWEPVALFCGVSYNFNTETLFETNKYEETLIIPGVYSPYAEYDKKSRENSVEHKDVYIYYESTEQYTSGEKYLSGVFFIQGYDYCNKKLKKKDEWQNVLNITDMDLFKEHVLKDPKTAIISNEYGDDVNIQMGGRLNMNDSHQPPEMYLCYTWTYNPKRAITNIVTFQGDSYNHTLPYTISKPDYESNVTLGYAAASTFSLENSLDIPSDPFSYTMRVFINPYNVIRNWRFLYVTVRQYFQGEELTASYTQEAPVGLSDYYSRTHVLPYGLYISGAAEGKEPLKLSDVIMTGTRHDGVEENGVVTFDVSGEKTLAGEAAVGAFKSVCEIKDPHSTKAQDISWPSFTFVNTNAIGSPSHMYERISMFIYIRDNGTNVIGKYISSVSVGSYSRDQYRRDYLSQKQTIDEKEYEKQLPSIDASVNQNAVIAAASSCADEMIYFNLSCDQNDFWFNRRDEKTGAIDWTPPDKDVPASFIGVTRTDKRSEAITGIVLYENNDTITAKQIKIDGAEYYCDSTTSPILLSGRNYYRYYTRNQGVNRGTPVENLSVNSQPMGGAGESTVLCAKPDSEKPYGNPDLPYYIHMQSEEPTGAFLNGIYFGKGATERKAQCDLLTKECSRYIHMDLNTAMGGDYLYLGYSMGYVAPDATAKQRKKAWNEAIYDIIITKNEPYQPEGFINEKNNVYYYPISDMNLNDGHDDADVLYMYFCSPYLSSRFNKAQTKNKTGIVTALPEEVFSAPLTKLAFARYDRVPYISVNETTGETETDIVPWEYVMFADHSSQADFTSGSAKFESEGYLIDNRVTMFAQRNDGSVKPAGEITGGFVAEYMEIGYLIASQRITR